VGLIFAIGLGISGMTQPSKVIGFLDITGNWDPSLAFVMVGAIGVHSIAYQFQKNRNLTFFQSPFQLPTNTSIDKALILGAILFGTGWGLGGFCPGPALVSLVSLSSEVLFFCGGMTAGFLSFKILKDAQRKESQ
jgi:uncharacterized membrane protein YedE/YeeE